LLATSSDDDPVFVDGLSEHLLLVAERVTEDEDGKDGRILLQLHVAHRTPVKAETADGAK